MNQPDNELLREYATTRSEEAFAELVRRHVNLVYSAALRQVGGDAHLAHDIAQSVFTDLARKAESLSRRESVTGWLYTSAHFAASKMVRADNRRREREEQFMSDPAHLPTPEPDWETLRPILDSAMHGLQETDREAVLLRYFENRPYAEVAAKLGLNENAARMRVERALEKLRTLLARRAITTTATLASVISANAVQVAPPALAATLTKTSIAAGARASFAQFKLMTLTQFKMGLGAVVVATAAATMVLQHQAQQQLHNENDSLRQQLAQLKSENGNFSNQVSAMGDSQSSSNSQLAELLKLRAEVTQLRKLTNSPIASTPSHITNDVASEKKAPIKAQIFLKIQFISAPENVLQTSAAEWAPAINAASVLSEQQWQEFKKLMEQDDQIHTIARPSVLTLNGREALTSVGHPITFDGTNVDIGPSLDVTPYYSPDSSTFTLNLSARLNQLTGSPSQPILETIQATNQVNLFRGQTAAMLAKITSAGIPGDNSDLPNRPGVLLIFVTPSLINEVGNLIPENTPATLRMVGDSANLADHGNP